MYTRLVKFNRSSEPLRPVSVPFDDNHEAHVPESEPQEDDLWDEPKPHVLHVLEIHMVEQGQKQPTRHLNHSQDHSHFHLQAVVELQLVLSLTPIGINSKNVWRSIVDFAGLQDACCLVGKPVVVLVAAITSPRFLTDRERPESILSEWADHHAEEIVVQESSVNSKDPHQNEDVPPSKHHSNNLIQARLHQLLLTKNEEGCHKSDNKPMPNIPIHDPE
mmetsp:Transcript_54133/g.90183  ORF Transcript_54133/g.90183 Transcript_54133/m.90183 type:complete len:219 (+) Transcript_54133:1006-1662(+)